MLLLHISFPDSDTSFASRKIPCSGSEDFGIFGWRPPQAGLSLIIRGEVQQKGTVAIMPEERAPQYAQGRRLDLLTNAHLAPLRMQRLREHSVVFTR